MQISVLSDGAWGTALALSLLQNDHDVTLWGPFADYVEQMAANRRNDRFLPEIDLPPALTLTADMRQAVDGADLLVLAAPVPYVRNCLLKVADAGFVVSQPVVNVAKGIEIDTLKRVSEIAQQMLGDDLRYCALCGPSHAEEVARNIPTALVAGSDEPALAELVQHTFMHDRLRIYTCDDPVGVELGAALKNVYAIAAGICDGMRLGDNPKAALMTRAIAEMARLGVAMGGQERTFSGLSGIGDLIVTCTSGHSRNRHVGEELGRGRKLEEVIAEMGMVVAEGVKTSKSAYALARQVEVETPILDEVYLGLFEGKDPRKGVEDLMNREAKPEW